MRRLSGMFLEELPECLGGAYVVSFHVVKEASRPRPPLVLKIPATVAALTDPAQ